MSSRRPGSTGWHIAEDLNVGRNIVPCLDDTNNKYAAVNTNVLKLYAMLDKKSDQLSYYQPGIGTFARRVRGGRSSAGSSRALTTRRRMKPHAFGIVQSFSEDTT